MTTESSRTSRSIPLLPSRGALESALVVGAGVAGLCTARQLLRIGVQVLVLEACPEIGGVWARNYDGFGLQIPWRHYQFPDFTWPKELQPEEEYPTGLQVQTYIKAYAERFDLMRHVRLNCKLLRLRWCAGSRQWEALFCDSIKEKFFKTKVDYTVICSGMYSSPHIPRYRGSELFAGLQLHAKDFTDMSVARGRRVVVVGAGRTAVDCATGLLASRCAATVTLLYRQLHWPVPRQLLGVPVRRLLFSRAAAAMLPPYYTAGPVDRAVHSVVQPLKRLFWRGVEAAIANKFGLSSGKWAEPQVSLPGDLFYGGQILDDSNARMMQCENLTAIKGEINQFVRNGVILQDGSVRAADVVLYCTGYEKSYDYFERDMRERLDLQKDGLYLYRNCLPCAVPHLAFVGSEVSTYSNILTDSLQALWLAHVLTGAVQLPGPDAMAADVRQQQRWRRDVMPAQRCRGAVLMMYGMQYHDQLLRDMGRQPKRKRVNPLAECFGAYSPEDYTGVVERHPVIAARGQGQRAPPAATLSLQTESSARDGSIAAAAAAAISAAEGTGASSTGCDTASHPKPTAHGAGFAAISNRSVFAAVQSRGRGRMEPPSMSPIDATNAAATAAATAAAIAAAAKAAAAAAVAPRQPGRCAVGAAGDTAGSRSGPLPRPHPLHLRRPSPSDPDDLGGRRSASASVSEEDDVGALSQIFCSSSSWKVTGSLPRSQSAAKRLLLLQAEGCSPGALQRSAACSAAPRTSPLGRPSSCRLQLCTYADTSMTAGRESSSEQVTSSEAWLFSSCAADTGAKALPVLEFWNAIAAAPVAARGGVALSPPHSAAVTAAATPSRQASSGLAGQQRLYPQQHPPPRPQSLASAGARRAQPLPVWPSGPVNVGHARYTGRNAEAVRDCGGPDYSTGIPGSRLPRASTMTLIVREPSGPIPRAEAAGATTSSPAKLGSSHAPDGAAACCIDFSAAAEYLPPPPPLMAPPPRPLAAMLRKQMQPNLPPAAVPPPPVTPPPQQATFAKRSRAAAGQEPQHVETASLTGHSDRMGLQLRLDASWGPVGTAAVSIIATTTTTPCSSMAASGAPVVPGGGASGGRRCGGSGKGRGVQPGSSDDQSAKQPPPSLSPSTSQMPGGMDAQPAATNSPAQCSSKSAVSSAGADAEGSAGGGGAAADGPTADGTSISNATRASLSSWHQQSRLLTGFVGASASDSPPPPPAPLPLSPPLSPEQLQHPAEEWEEQDLATDAMLVLADFEI